MRPRPCAANAVAAAASRSCNRESPWKNCATTPAGPSRPGLVAVEVQCVRTRAVVQRHGTGGEFRVPTVLFESTAPFGLHVRQQILLVGTRDELPGRRTREASARTVEISKSVKLACTIWPANVPGPVGAADSCTKVSQIRSRQYSNARIGATAEVDQSWADIAGGPLISTRCCRPCTFPTTSTPWSAGPHQ